MWTVRWELVLSPWWVCEIDSVNGDGGHGLFERQGIGADLVEYKRTVSKRCSLFLLLRYDT